MHGCRVGVIALVDDGDATALAADDDALAASGLCVPAGESASSGLGVCLSELHRRKHSKRVLNKMNARCADAIGDGLAENVGLHLGGLGPKLNAEASRVRAGCLAEADDSRLPLQRVAAQAVVMRIIAVEDGDAAWH